MNADLLNSTAEAFSPSGLTMLAVSLLVLIALAYPIGSYAARVYNGERIFLSPVLGWLERLVYAGIRLDPSREMDWREYARNLLIFSFVSFLALYFMLRGQEILGFGFYPAVSGMSPDLAFNTAVSFTTNTNWQAYTPETQLAPIVQVGGIVVQNFMSAAVGMAVLAALSRAFARRKAETIGNFWADLLRGALYILLPLSLLLALALVASGVPQTLEMSATAHPIEMVNGSQIIPLGPVASQVAIKQLGSNGGGFFNANAAHPMENPSAVSNFLEFLSILLLPAAMCVTFGRMVGNKKQGLAILVAMLIIFAPLASLGVVAEMKGNPYVASLGVTQKTSELSSGGNMEGKETRIGAANAVLWAAATTASSNGSTNAALDSFTPLGGFVPLLFMQFGDVVFGGVGTGLCSMLVFVVLSVFVAGLMVGRSPEYLGKKIEPFEMKMVCLAVLSPHMASLIGTAIAVLTNAGQVGATNPYAQGFSEILYAFSSAANNNGSAFGGLAGQTPFYNIALGLAMLVGRFFVIVPMLAMAGSMVRKNTAPVSAGTLDTTQTMFVFILIAIIVLVGVLTFVPALALGPIAEHFHLLAKG